MGTNATRHFVADLVAGAQDVRSPAQLGQFVLERLVRVVPYDSAIFIPPNPESGESPVFVNKESFRLLYGLTRQHPGRYLPIVEKMRGRALASGGVARDTDCISSRERDRNAFYADVLRPQAIKQQIVAPPVLRGTNFGLIFMCRHGRSSEFADRTLAALSRLMPAIALATAAVRSLLVDRQVADPLDPAPSHNIRALPPRETEITRLVTDGLTNREIALVLGTSPHTVRNQLSRIFDRLGIASRLELAMFVRSS